MLGDILRFNRLTWCETFDRNSSRSFVSGELGCGSVRQHIRSETMSIRLKRPYPDELQWFPDPNADIHKATKTDRCSKCTLIPTENVPNLLAGHSTGENSQTATRTTAETLNKTFQAGCKTKLLGTNITNRQLVKERARHNLLSRPRHSLPAQNIVTPPNAGVRQNKHSIWRAVDDTGCLLPFVSQSSLFAFPSWRL